MTEKSLLSVIGPDGDTRVEWDPTIDEEVSAARQTFDKLIGKGYHAFRVRVGDQKGDRITSFEPLARRIIMAKPVIGG